MLLEGRNAVVHGGGGSIGGAAARGFARAGATVYLAGRGQEALDAVANEIRVSGGKAETSIVDALDEHQVDAHADAVAAEAGSIDICMNAINHGDVQGTPLIEMSLEDFEAPVRNGVRTNFLAWRAAARHMVKRGSGVIIAFGGEGEPLRDHHLGGLQVGLTAIEAMRRSFAAELGPSGIRVVTLKTGGVPEGIPDSFEQKAAIEEMITEQTLMGYPAGLDDVGNVAAFVASDHARAITGSVINISVGAEID